MANALYPSYKELCLGSGLNLSSLDIRSILVDLADYTYSTAHNFLDDVAAGARVAVSGAMTGKSITNGIFDAANVTWSSVTGDQSEAIIIYYHTGVESTSSLIAFIDTGVTGFPVTPNGGDITCQWDDGANKIFAL